MKSQTMSIFLILILLLGFFLFATNVEAQPGQVGLKTVFNDSLTEVTPGFEGISSLTVTRLTTGTVVSTLDFSVLVKAENAISGVFTATLDVKLDNVIKDTFEINQQISLNANEGVEIPVGTLTAETIESYALFDTLAEYDLELKVSDCRVEDIFFNSQSMIIPLEIDTTINNEPPTGGGTDPVVDDPVENPDPEPSPVIFSNGFEEGSLSSWDGYTSGTPTVVTTSPYAGTYCLYSNTLDEEVYKNFEDANDIYVRAYLKIPSGSLPTSEWTGLGGIQLWGNGGNSILCQFKIIYVSGSINVMIQRWNPSDSVIREVYNWQPDTWYSVEIHYAKGSTGGYECWVNNVLVISDTVDTGSGVAFDQVRTGLCAISTSGVGIYVDNVVVSTEKIGS